MYTIVNLFIRFGHINFMLSTCIASVYPEHWSSVSVRISHAQFLNNYALQNYGIKKCSKRAIDCTSRLAK